MTDEELKKKCTERAKIFQQAMESCHSSSPIDCIEWFADRIAELEAQIEKMKEVISELIAITDKDICKDCDGGIHCSECYVNHAQTYASHFINEKEIKEK